MCLRLHKEVDLTTMISRDGGQTAPDEEAAIDGGAGQAEEDPLWVAPEQTDLDGGIDDSQTDITLTAARFAATKYSIIRIEDELCLITGGHGTINLTVTRGYHGTTPAAHADGVAVISAYNYTSNQIDCTDNEGSDESGWMLYCDDSGGSPDGSWEAPHSIGNINYNQSLKIWRKVTVPASTAPGRKIDLEHNLTFTADEVVVS